jgi:hypothetical protein
VLEEERTDGLSCCVTSSVERQSFLVSAGRGTDGRPFVLRDVISGAAEFMVSVGRGTGGRPFVLRDVISGAAEFMVSAGRGTDGWPFVLRDVISGAAEFMVSVGRGTGGRPFVLRDVISGAAEFMVSVGRGTDGRPFVFGQNLQCRPVRGVNTPEECHCSHARQRFKRSKGVNSMGILECKFLSENAHRATSTAHRPAAVALGRVAECT